MQENPPLIDAHTLHSKRPLSPHLSIYKLQLTSGLSILHRITGAYLYLGLVLLAWSLLCSIYFPFILNRIGDLIDESLIASIIAKLFLFTWAFALFYHQLNGIRHLFWDVGKGFDIRVAYITGRLVVSLSILITIICWVYV